MGAESGFGCEFELVHCVVWCSCLTHCTGAFDPVQTMVWVQARVQIPLRIRARIRSVVRVRVPPRGCWLVHTVRVVWVVMYVCKVRGRGRQRAGSFKPRVCAAACWGGVGATDRRECHFSAGCGIVELRCHGWLGARPERAAPETGSRSTGGGTHGSNRVTVVVRSDQMVVKIWYWYDAGVMQDLVLVLVRKKPRRSDGHERTTGLV